MNETDLLMLRNAARDLIESARQERSLRAATDDERAFYFGVDAAATEVLRPELQMTRGEGWLDREPPAFREGYLRTTALLGRARTAGGAPGRIRLPRRDERLSN